MVSARRSSAASLGFIVSVLVGGMVLCWILLTPPGAGPDEPGHLARAGAIARGQLAGEDVGAGRASGFDLPGAYVLPEPRCYAFHPEIPANCAASQATPGGDVTLLSTADEYPIWGHVPPGLFSRMPGLSPIWWARVGGGATVAALLVAAISLAARSRALGGAGILVALTPMSWGIFAVINPSGMAIAGAVALWVALVYGDDRSRLSRWTAAFGWAALALPRRDGLVWACIALAIVLCASGRTLVQWSRGLGRGPLTVVIVSSLATVIWGLTADSRVTRLLVIAPIGLIAVELFRWAWWTRATSRARRVVAAVLAGGVVLVGMAAVAATRPGGWDADLTASVIAETGYNLVEAIGVLGWLDTRLPVMAVALVCGALGVLAAASLAQSAAPARWAAISVAIAIVTAWLFELAQGNNSGTYWQGRYSLPLLIGAPVLLGSSSLEHRAAQRVLAVAGGLSLLVVNVAAWAAARRWGVGIHGSFLPWDWNTWDAPVPPVLVLGALAVLSAGLGVTLWRAAGECGRDEQAAGTKVEAIPTVT